MAQIKMQYGVSNISKKTLTLFNNGTGSDNFEGRAYTSSGTRATYNISDKLYVELVNCAVQNSTYAFIKTKNLFDFSKYKKIYIKGKATVDQVVICLLSTNFKSSSYVDPFNIWSTFNASVIYSSGTGDFETTIDVPTSFQTQMYLYIERSYTANCDAYVEKIQLISEDRTIKKYLYKEGDERINITGGWGTYGATYYANSRTMSLELGTKNTDNLYTGGSTSTTTKGFSPQNKIDFTGYKYLCIDGYRSNAINVWDCFIRINAVSRAFTDSDIYFNDFPITREVKKYDITNYQSNYYMMLASDSSSSRFGYIYNMWLEK